MALLTIGPFRSALLLGGGRGLFWRGRLLVAGGLVVGMLGGCHAVFDGELETVRCEAEGAYGPPACPVGETCVEGICALVGAPLGAACAADGDCRARGWCLDPATMGMQGAPRCSRPCCASMDCGPPEGGQVCFTPGGTAGSMCWPHHELGRSVPGPAPGGASCAAGEECRSGWCEKSCVDVCCGDVSCDADKICRLKVAGDTGADTWSCGLPPSEADERFCMDDQDCRRGRCLLVEGLPAKICAEPCCGSSECGLVEVADVSYQLACTAVDGARACAAALPKSADGAVGAGCTGDEDCRSGLCIEHEGDTYCSDLCCDDASCGDLSRFACRPGPSNGFSALRCIRK